MRLAHMYCCSHIIFMGHSHTSRSGVMFRRRAHASYSRTILTCHPHSSCSFVMLTRHTHSLCSPVMLTRHAHPSYSRVRLTRHAPKVPASQRFMSKVLMNYKHLLPVMGRPELYQSHTATSHVALPWQ